MEGVGLPHQDQNEVVLAIHIRDFLQKQVKVSKVHVDGVRRTRNDFVAGVIQDSGVLAAKTIEEVLKCTQKAKSIFQELGIFKTVDICLDKDEENGGVEVTMDCNEFLIVGGSAGTQVGTNEGNMVVGGRLINVFGRAENFTADVSTGTNTKTSYRVGFMKPISRSLNKKFSLDARKSLIDFPFSSFMESSHSVTADLSFPSWLGSHSVTWEGAWRRIMGIPPLASFDIRQHAGRSLKSSVKHTLVMDGRDNGEFPTQGHFIKFSQEYSGLLGDVNFIKSEGEVKLFGSGSWDSIFSMTAKAGFLKSFSEKSHINDRFFLGGPLSIRGFKTFGIGPRRQSDSLGGDMYWSLGLHLYTPLPFRPGGFAERFRTHIFATGGNITQFTEAIPWKKRMEYLGENVRWSYGAGLVLLAGIARFELNYCILGWNSLTDSINPGLQFGVGINDV
ncbi:sorting and assembly machinery component 50 homolog A-like [Dendronephthya gigantea]|uniref:sorting and assembly machinery component 50 homolog A-like n=1 Tax=Dendronephthya gigantea TaxID=151771 RepID=UPI00106A31B2|nr:sorting and assembly machinery component 50 homolog A-like [Dendronephthya gigantea]